MTKATMGARMYRANLMLADDDSAWLDLLAEEIHTQNGAKVSRSEIVRAALAGLRELHRLAPEFAPLTKCRRGEDLTVMAVIAERMAMASMVAADG